MYPIYCRIMVDPKGVLWLNLPATAYDLSGRTLGSFSPRQLGSEQWDLFTLDGVPLGKVRFPSSFVPTYVREDLIAGYFRNDSLSKVLVVEEFRIQLTRVNGDHDRS